MSTACKKGEIWRVGYTRSVGKKKSKISGKCIAATSQSGKKSSLETKKILAKKKTEHVIARTKFGIPECKKGEIIKEGYKRKSKTNKETWVAPTCVKSQGKGKREQIIYIEPGRLSKYGYDDIERRSDISRHKALATAIYSGEKPLSVSRRLNALSVLTRNTNPRLSDVFKSDSEWIKQVKT